MHVAYGCDAAYLPWCAAAMRSCLDHVGGEGLTLHLLHDSSLDDEPGVEQLASMVEAAGARLLVHRADPKMIDALPLLSLFGSRAVWLRMLLPNLLPDVERVLYLDVDTLVVQPLEPLFNTDLRGAPIAAVTNVYSQSQRGRIEELGILDHRRYFNSGVLLLDLEVLRAERSVAQLTELVARRAPELAMADQDALNLHFSARWVALHPRWNAQYKLWEDPVAGAEVFGTDAAREAVRSPAIVHFEGPGICKPWHALNEHPWRSTWWSTLRRTPFDGTPPFDRTLLRFVPTRYVRIRLYLRLVAWRQRRARRAELR